MLTAPRWRLPAALTVIIHAHGLVGGHLHRRGDLALVQLVDIEAVVLPVSLDKVGIAPSLQTLYPTLIKWYTSRPSCFLAIFQGGNQRPARMDSTDPSVTISRSGPGCFL